ncbi:MAG: hypothetical protein H6836_01730 [Planctomycetes bacterium]|nr:hypothetical protein [Planctomycetota bacterium]MCB9888266.1 hypothetical protein [Planctomycetota bacterium]
MTELLRSRKFAAGFVERHNLLLDGEGTPVVCDDGTCGAGRTFQASGRTVWHHGAEAKLTVQRIVVESRELTLAEFLRIGDSFRICCELHLWPPLRTLNSFLRCGVDDVGQATVEWLPIEVDDHDYDLARTAVDPDGAIAALGAKDGDWQSWFTAAVAILRSR